MKTKIMEMGKKNKGESGSKRCSTKREWQPKTNKEIIRVQLTTTNEFWALAHRYVSPTQEP